MIGDQQPDSSDKNHHTQSWDWGVVALVILALALLAVVTMEWWLPHSGGH